MTETFGSRLRRARERRHVELADIAAKTKIKSSLFEAIERDDASHWPSGIFRRSFMRSYAEAIGLDPDATVREFLERFPDPAAPADADTTSPSPNRSSSSDVLSLAPTPDRSLASGSSHTLRLTLVETGFPFTGGRYLADARRRWSAAAWDLGSLLAIALSIFVFMNTFWMPFGVTALCYYIGGILLLGNSPGVCLFAPKSTDTSSSGGSAPSRVQRHRSVEDAPVRAEAAFRTARFRAERRREARH